MLEILLRTKKPVASESPDHLVPRGAKQDSSRNPLFSKKLYGLFNGKEVNVLDLGCAGGAFVKDCIDDGNLAVGLEGSDYCHKTGRAEWQSIPENLFTCDITADFSLGLVDTASAQESTLKFDVITAWEVMEHIPENDLGGVCENVIRQLKKDGLWIMSVADFEDTVGNTSYHQTVHDKGWWLRILEDHGFRNQPQLVDYFGHDWIRGPYQGSGGFHLVLTFGDGRSPRIPATAPYSAQDMVDTGELAIEQAIEQGTANALSLEYALLLFEDAKKRAGALAGVDYRRALALLYLGRLDQAAGAVLAELDCRPDYEQARHLWTQIESLRDDDTIRGFDEFLIRLHRGVRLREGGDLEASRADLQRAVELRPVDEGAAQHLRETIKPLVHQAMEQADWGRAVDLLGQFPGPLPEDPEWHFLIAQVLQRQGAKLPAARQHYELALRYGYDESGIRLHRGILLRELGDLAGSRGDLERAVELRPEDDDTKQHLRETLKRLPAIEKGRGIGTGRIQGGRRGRAGGPKISIVTPTYNCAPFLRTCIESVLAQGYENFEHIVVDGASTDGTVEILKQYPHLKWISEPDDGEAQALNKALALVSGDMIGWLNGDDCYVAGALGTVGETLDAAPDRHIVYGKTVFIGEDGIPTTWVIPYAPLNLATLTRWFRLNLFQPSIFFSTRLYRDVGPFREDLNYGVDYEYWFRIAHKGYRYHYVDQVFSKAMIYRSGGKTETPYAVKAQEWLEICCSFLAHLGEGERIHFWKDYYEFRFRNHGDRFYYDNAPVEVADNPEAVSGFMLAVKELGLIHGKTINPVLQDRQPDSANLLGILGEHLRHDGRAVESAKAFEWALALQSRDPSTRHRFGIDPQATGSD